MKLEIIREICKYLDTYEPAIGISLLKPLYCPLNDIRNEKVKNMIC